MDFAEAHAAFFQPRDDAEPSHDTRGTASPARRLRHALEPLAMVQVWSTPAQDRMAAGGLNFLTGYVGGRASTLGDVAPNVVAATFGVFEPDLIGGLWTSARAQCSVEQLLEMRMLGAAEGMQAALDGVDPAEIEKVVAVLRRGTDAVGSIGLVARPLFASLRGLPWPEDPYAGLWHVASLFREHRGDTHLAACAAADVDGLEANLLTELYCGFSLLEYTATRGWSPEAMDTAITRLERRGWIADGTFTDTGLAARTAVEDATDRAQDRVIEALGDLEPLLGTLEPWADAVVARDWFPPDPYKRAAG